MKFPRLHLLSCIVVFVLLLALAIGIANLVFGDLNQDEGWYLYAAQNVARGQLPYRDFFFTQGPVMPVVYAALAPLWSVAGVLGGRGLTLILGLIGAALAGFLAAQRFPKGSRMPPWIITFALTACSVYHSYFTVIPKTYALTSLFLVGACMLLSKLQSRVAVFIAGLLFACATATRISMAAGAVAAAIWLILQHRRAPWQWLTFATGGIVGLMACFGFFWLTAWDQWLFANQFHAAREGGGLMLVAGSAARLLRGYFPLGAVGTLAVFLTLFGKKETPPHVGLWVAVAASIAALQWLSPFPYDDYQVPVMPLFAAAAAVVLCTHLRELPLPAPLAVCFITVMVTLNAISSPNVQSWFFIRQDRFWPVMKSTPDVVRLTRVAKTAKRGSLLLTQDTYLAVAGGCLVPRGFEMGPFGYFPALSDEEATRQHVLNTAMLERVLDTTEAKVAMFSGYAFSIAAPSMTRLPDDTRGRFLERVAARFTWTNTEPDFGQGHTFLVVMRRE